MCKGKKPKDNSAQIEAQRQQRIAEGTARIDEVFSSFNDDFYKQKTDAYKNFYVPEIDRQYKSASDKLINSLGANLNGSEGAKAIGELTRQYEAEKNRIIQASLDYGNNARATTANQRAQLISQLEGGGSVQNTADLARNYASGVARQDNFTPLANLFAGSTAQFANARNAESMGYAPVDTGFFNARGSRATREIA